MQESPSKIVVHARPIGEGGGGAWDDLFRTIGRYPIDYINETRSEAPDTVTRYTNGDSFFVEAQRTHRTSGPAADLTWYVWIHFATPLTIGQVKALRLLMSDSDINVQAGSVNNVEVTIALHAVAGSDWNPATLTWNNQPDLAALGDDYVQHLIELPGPVTGGAASQNFALSLDMASYWELNPENEVYGLRLACTHSHNDLAAFVELSHAGFPSCLRGYVG